MDSNTVGTLIFIIIVAIIFSFLLGYFFACTRLHNKMINAEIKFVESKTKAFKDLEMQTKVLKEEDIPEELRGILNNIIEDIENEEKENNKR